MQCSVCHACRARARIPSPAVMMKGEDNLGVSLCRCLLTFWWPLHSRAASHGQNGIMREKLLVRGQDNRFVIVELPYGFELALGKYNISYTNGNEQSGKSTYTKLMSRVERR